MDFQCNGCGCCCKHIGNAVRILRSVVNGHPGDPEIDPRLQVLIDFPFNYDQSGQCEKYDEQVGCTVYENRPLICQVNSMYDFYKEELTYDQYVKETQSSCNLLMDLYESAHERFLKID